MNKHIESIRKKLSGTKSIISLEELIEEMTEYYIENSGIDDGSWVDFIEYPPIELKNMKLQFSAQMQDNSRYLRYINILPNDNYKVSEEVDGIAYEIDPTEEFIIGDASLAFWGKRDVSRVLRKVYKYDQSI